MLHPQLEPTETGGDGAAEQPSANTGEVAAMTARQAGDAAIVAAVHPDVPSGGQPTASTAVRERYFRTAKDRNP